MSGESFRIQFVKAGAFTYPEKNAFRNRLSLGRSFLEWVRPGGGTDESPHRRTGYSPARVGRGLPSLNPRVATSQSLIGNKDP